MKIRYVVIGSVVAIVVAFAVGESLGQHSMIAGMSVQLDGTQAMLAFNRLDDERQLQTLLSKGCVTQAQSQLDYYEDRDTKLLSEFFKGKLDPETRKYVSDRDSKLAESLSSFRSKYGDRWDEPACK